MYFRTFLAASAASLSLACGLAAAPAAAQDTTAAIDGQVTADSGAPKAGAKVTVVHVPSGTVSTATTDAGGNYSLRGLRVGGPYSVTVDAAGYAPAVIDGVQLSVGDTLGLPVQLGVREIVVAGQAIRVGRELNTGSVSTFTAEDIAGTVSARRDIRDVIRKDLLASYNANVGGVSIAGGNIRTQRFSVDGVQMQDSFGLNYGGLPSTRGIISMEAIDQLTVKAAPFDVSEGNFQGGAVNVVMKSGTNDFHASAFGNFGSADWTGDITRNNRNPIGGSFPVAKTTILKFTNYGGAVSGPIIKDKLFFSAAYERLSEGTPNSFGIAGSQAPNIVPNVAYADSTAYRGLTSIFNAFTANYGTFPIGDVPTAISERDVKYSGKLDWNITEGHRFSASFIHHENALPSFANSSSGSTSTSTPFISVLSNLYSLTEFTNAFSAQLNSQWSDRFSTEVRGSYKYYRRGQEAFNGADFAEFRVCADNTSSALDPDATKIAAAETICNSGVPIVRMGPDTARQANKFNNKILTIQANATLRAGAHTFKLEYDNMHSRLYNLFVFGTSGLVGTGGPQGLYYFDSYADFAARQANELVLNSTTTGNKNDGFVDWGYTVHTVAGQDTWRAAGNLTFSAGLRYDFYAADKTITANPNFSTRFGNLYPGLTNTSTMDGRGKLQPRFGFNWAVTPQLKLAGGVGLFAGGLSDVFISNNYSNSGAALNATGAVITGIDLVRVTGGCIDRSTGNSTARGTLSPAVCAGLGNVNGATPNAAALAYLQTNTGVLANATTNSLDPRFKLPAQWKYNLSLSWRPEFGESALARGWSLRGDVLFSDAQQAIRWIDLRAQPLVVNGVTQVAPDGRARYGGTLNAVGNAAFQPGSNSDIQLTNTTAGKARVFAVGVEKAFDWGNFSASWTHQKVKDVAGILVSSTVGSSYSVVTSDPNSGGDYGRSVFEVTDMLRAAFEVKHEFFRNAQTRFGLSWSLRSGVPYSMTMFDSTSNATSGRASVFGTVNTSSHLLYVPNFGAAPTTAQLVQSGVTYNAPQYGNVIFGSSLSSGTAAQHEASAAANLASMQGLVNGTVLKNYQGRIMPKNLLTGPRFTKIDLNFAQDIPIVGRSKLTALFSVENFLNLLNHNWGSYQEYGTPSVIRVACATGTVAGQTCANYVYSSYSDPRTQTYPKASLWALRAGVRFSF